MRPSYYYVRGSALFGFGKCFLVYLFGYDILHIIGTLLGVAFDKLGKNVSAKLGCSPKYCNTIEKSL